MNSLFAALSAVLITIVATDSLPRELKYWENKYKFVDLLFTLFSFFLFAMSAEGTTNAYDEKDVRKYVYYLLLYNLGVIFIGSAIAVVVAAHFLQHLGRFVQPLLWFLNERSLLILVAAVYFLGFVVLQGHWIEDVRWLLFSSSEEFVRYLKELTDEVEPEAAPTRFMKLFYRCRKT